MRLRYSLLGALLAAFATPALAAGTVDVSPLYGLLDQFEANLAQGLILASVGYAVYLLHALALKVPFLGRLLVSSNMETNLANGLNTALKNGVAIALAKQSAWEAVHQNVAVQGAVQRMAVQYAIDRAPQAVRHFGLGPDELAEKALAFLPVPSIGLDSTGAMEVPRAPVEVRPLAPVS